MKKEIIVAVKRDNLDRIVEFKTNKNNIYNYEMAKEAINKNLIENAVVVLGKDSLYHIREKSNINNSLPFQKIEEFK